MSAYVKASITAVLSTVLRKFVLKFKKYLNEPVRKARKTHSESVYVFYGHDIPYVS